MDGDFKYFRFRPINKYLIESLVNPSLYFAKPEELNDPFDCNLDIKRAIENFKSSVIGLRERFLAELLDKSEFFENWKLQLGNVGVCSFSNNANETLMWSHYADDHRGVRLLYQFPWAVLLEKFKPVVVMGEVEYSTERLTKLLTRVPMEMETFVTELVHVYLKTKNPAWGYEKEVRIIRRKHGVLNIPGAFLKQICFGLRTPQSDIDLVIKLAQQYCGCTNFGKMVPDETDFGFTMQPYS